MSSDLSTDAKSDIPVSPETDNFLRAEAIVAAINANLPAGAQPLPVIPKDFVFKQRHRAVVTDAVNAVFELRGGVSGLLQFANNHPKEFYTGIWAKMMPPETVTQSATTIVFASQIPTNPLDLVNVDATGKVYSIDADVVPE